MLRIGLTGGIGSGKSTAASCFEALGVPVTDADAIAHELMAAGSEAERQVIESFGSGILAADGHIDRDLLRKVVFSDPARRTRLEQIIHPLVYRRIRDMLESIDSPYCIVMIPLLVETGQSGLFDRILVVDVPEEAQVSRTMQRSGLDETGVRNIMANQVKRKTRLAHADDVIDNSGSQAQLQQQVERLHRMYLSISADSTV